MEMQMKLFKVPYGQQNKDLSKRELDRYFNVISLEDLVFTLYQFATRGYFKYEVTLSSEYLDWEEAHTHAMLDTSPLKPTDPFGALRQPKHHLAILGREVKTDVPLSAAEISEVIRVLPTDMAERYLRFKLINIDQKKLRDVVAAQSELIHSADKDEDYTTLKYHGLVADGAEITYLGDPIQMGFQQRQLLRAFLERPEALLAPDVFTDNPEIFNPKKLYPKINQTLSKLISEVHRILQGAIGEECIFNTPSEGWSLRIG
jgi:hypothetical protein